MKRPSFFIVGAPKSGTTALYEQLRTHPDIYMPRKELYYFGRDLSYKDPRPSSDYYHRLFEPASEDQLAGEASVWYLLSAKAAEEIAAYREDARVIIMLRDPVEMLHSLHFEQLNNGNEEIESFEEALEAEAERKKGERIPSLIGCPYEALQYREVGRYKEQVERYLDVFGQERVHIIFFDDFVRDPGEAYRKTLDFLGLEPDREPSQERINPPQRPRFKALRDFLKRRPEGLIKLSKFLLPSRNLRQTLLNLIESANRKQAKKPPLKAETRDKLREELRPDLQALGHLLGEDLEERWWDE